MDILVGLQWGDEGKGKFIDLICRNYDIVARFNGGANAGHTIYHQGKKVSLRLLPSGVFYPHIKNIIGTGVALDPSQLKTEILQLKAVDESLEVESRLLISEKAHLVLPTYRYLDIYYEGNPAFRTIGTTKNGVGQTYSSKILRQGLRVADMYRSDFEQRVREIMRRQYDELRVAGEEIPDYSAMITTFLADIAFLKTLPIGDTEIFINRAIKQGKKVLAEGAQATLLDIDHGTYPYVTSSNTIAAGACTGLGVSPLKVGEIFGVTKAYCTRVGNGAFPTEVHDELADELRQKGNEFGSNTKRPRRIGWLDLPALKYAVMLNGVTQLIVTKADILNEMEAVQVCTHYQVDGREQEFGSTNSVHTQISAVLKSFEGWDVDFSRLENKEHLPLELTKFICFLEDQLEIPVRYLSIGPRREQIICIGK
jgi:adenylosuccinate synthase